MGRRLDPETGAIYHLTYNKPPAEIADRLIQRSDDTEDKLRNRLAGHHRNVNAVVGYYISELIEVWCATLPVSFAKLQPARGNSSALI